MNAPEDYDREAIFEHADPVFVRADELGNPPAQPFTLSDIDSWELESYEQNGDGANMYGLVRLRNGEWAALESWHDQTGWD